MMDPANKGLSGVLALEPCGSLKRRAKGRLLWREEAEALHTEIAKLVVRADAFNRMVTERLSNEAKSDAEKVEQLRRFRNARRIKVELAAF